MARLVHIAGPKGSAYASPTVPSWPVGEEREVDDEVAAALLSTHPSRFATVAPSLVTPAAPSLTRAAPVVEADDGAAPAPKRKRATRKRKASE